MTSSYKSAVNRYDVIYPLKPKISFINECSTLEATSLLTIHFQLLDLRTCRLSTHLINRTRAPLFFPFVSFTSSSSLRHLCPWAPPPPPSFASISHPAAASTWLRQKAAALLRFSSSVSLSLSHFVDLFRAPSFIAFHQSSSGFQWGSVPPYLWIKSFKLDILLVMAYFPLPQQTFCMWKTDLNHYELLWVQPF